MEEQEGSACGWPRLPVEIQDLILHHVVQHKKDVSWLMDLVLQFVCVRWKERRPFWHNKKIAGRKVDRVTDGAATLGSVPLMKWLQSLGYPLNSKHCPLGRTRRSL